MKQEDKELLLKDLCSRLPYNTIVSMAEGEIDFTECKIKWNKKELTISLLHQIEEEGAWGFVKPYLRPMSSMTEEECIELGNIEATIEEVSKVIPNVPYYIEVVSSKQIDWLNAHHFDYFGLIEKGLAIAVTQENNPYKIAEG